MTISRGDRCPVCHRKHRRSNPANSRYWALLHLCAERLADGQYSAEQMHVYFKSKYLGCDDVQMPNGKTLTIPRSTAGLDVAEFGEYMDKVEADAAQRGVFLADLEA